VGDRIPVQHIFSQKNGSHTWDFTIVGIFKGRTAQNDTNVMLLQYAYFDETRSFGKDMIGWLMLRTKSTAMNDQVIKAVDEMFANSPYETANST
jgi:putative ABC transport system permease protein